MPRVFLAALVAIFLAPGLVVPGAVAAQSGPETLADIRQDLSVLFVELRKLKRELNTTGAPGDLQIGGSLIDRVAAIESEVQRLTAKTEQLEFRIEAVVSDGTNRVGDLEFRLCELEPGCDPSGIEPGETLGGAAAPGASVGQGGVAPRPDSGGSGDIQLAVGEQADFDAANAALEAGRNDEAAALFTQFWNAYPGSPLAARAGLGRGKALEAGGDLKAAARAYLDTFSAEPAGAQAAEALYLLGRALGGLGQIQEGCRVLSEIPGRFPGAPEIPRAQAAKTDLGCS